jgi:Gram-negative bacterial TonB protein C-terminal/PilZ domain
MSNLQEYFGALTPARDRRLQKRTTPASLTFVDLGGTNGGIILNISEAGIAVAVADRLPAGKYFPCIRFRPPSSSQSIEISAQVVWLAESKKGAGIRFADLTADARNQIANWIASEKSVAEIEHLPQPLRQDKQPQEVSSCNFRRIFSSSSVRDEDGAARYAEMFPSESAYAKRTTTVGEIKPQQSPLPTPVRSNTDPAVSILRSAAKISTGDLPQTSSLPPGQTALEPVAPSASDTPVILDVSPLQVAALVFLFAVIGLIIGIAAAKTSVDILASLGRGPFGKQVRLRSQSPHTRSVSGPPSDSAPIVAPNETSSSQTSRSSVDLDSSAGAKTVGSSRPPEEKAKEGTRDSDLAVKVPSTDSNSSSTPEPQPSANPAERPNRDALTGRSARSAPLPASAEHAHSAVAVGPTRSAPRNRALLTTKPTRTAAPKPSQPTANLKHAYQAVTVGPRGTVPGNPGAPTAKHATPAVPNPPPPANSEPAPRAVAAGPKGPGPGNPTPDPATPATTATATSPPPASPKPADPAVAGGSLGAAPGNPGPPTAKSATPAVPNPPPRAYLVTIPSKGSKPLTLVFPQKQVALSSSFSIITQLSILISPEPGPGVAHQPARLQAGNLVSYVEPRQPSPRDRYRSTETVKLRATIGEQGQVIDVKPVSGPIFLLSSAMSAIRHWRYQPTLLNERPVKAQQDVTVEFRLLR